MPAKKISKGKFSLLLSSNLIVWLIFAVSFFDLEVFSMPSLPPSINPGAFKVTGIVYNEISPSAIVDNEIYGVGDEIDGYTITAIGRTEVVFRKGDKIIVRQPH